MLSRRCDAAGDPVRGRESPGRIEASSLRLPGSRFADFGWCIQGQPPPCRLVTPGNHDRKSSREAPPSRFSNKATTGTRVWRKTQDPPTFSGLRSTSGHEDQSIIAEPYSRSFGKGKRGKASAKFEPAVGLASVAVCGGSTNSELKVALLIVVLCRKRTV